MAYEVKVARDQNLVGKYLHQFQITCQIATQDASLFSKNNSTTKEEKYSHSYEEADEITEQLSINLMKEIWNISLDE